MPKVSLKSCPYCGAEAKITANLEKDLWLIRCTACSAQMSGWREEEPRYFFRDQHDNLIREWNKRHGTK